MNIFPIFFETQMNGNAQHDSIVPFPPLAFGVHAGAWIGTTPISKIPDSAGCKSLAPGARLTHPSPTFARPMYLHVKAE